MIEKLRQLLGSHYQISTRLYFGIGGAVSLTMLASIVGWFSLNAVDNAQNQVNNQSIPELVVAFGLAEYSSSLAAAAPRLSTAETPEELAEIYGSIVVTNENIAEQLALLENIDRERNGQFQELRDSAMALTRNIEVIKEQRAQLIELAKGKAELSQSLADLRSQLDSVLIPAIDNQLFYTVTGYEFLGGEAAPFERHFSPEQVDRYRILAELKVDANTATELLGNSFTLSQAANVEPLRERFEAASSRIERNLAALEGTEIHDQIAPAFQALEALGSARNSGFNLIYRELRLAEQQRDLLLQSQEQAVNQVHEVDGLVVAARANADSSTRRSSQVIITGRILLMVITAASLIGAFLIAWLWVGRHLIRRIEALANRMRQMAQGDLEAQVEVDGNDEVAEMGAALEIFRRHALEVQRLNLVEKLAQDLQGKNDELETIMTNLRQTQADLEGKNNELETAMTDLRQVQDQMVAQQKLADLGELTAGVAHEIRNPLNFVKNFSEASEELLVELKEALEESGDQLNEEQRGLIEDISSDLSENFDRIRSHGERANRIVNDMLLMSRGAGEFQSADINMLVNEHARLAFHSARALDTDFQLDLQWDLDPNAGELPVIPQDLGRVFLNMVSNACYATNEKRQTASPGENYFPTLLVATKRSEDGVEVRIRDNGNGMPPEVIERIFNPFFTTKPTGQGTGLGLAISNDIVREHGGSIRVNSEPGQFTEMIVTLPLAAPILNTANGLNRVDEPLEQETTV